MNNNAYYINESGQSKDSWFKEEEVMRKKLEKGAIAQLKSRIAQQNRAAGNNKAHVEQVDGNDSDMDPNEAKDDLMVGGATGPVAATQVQLNPA
jgi:hypothetical protein